MFFENYYINFSKNSTINIISSYKDIMNKFILMFIQKKKNDYIKNSNMLYTDALIYSKYYLYWEIYGCVYLENIMNILYDIKFIK
jgi:hypothetical protein